MAQATPAKDQLRRERLREYDAALTAARSPVAVLVQLVKGRQARSDGAALEEAFAATRPDGSQDAEALPAAVWVALRQGDVDAALDVLLRVSKIDFVLSAHEELDAGYRLTTVEERRPLPDLELLQAQLAAFLQLPPDVLVMLAGWGPDDPRTVEEIQTLLDQRFGRVTSVPAEPPAHAGVTGAAAGAVPAAAGAVPTPSADGSADRARPADSAGSAVDVLNSEAPSAGLQMSSAEFTALLNLSPQQRAVLGTLVRQTDITIVAG